MSKKTNFFDDKTFLSIPNPIDLSTMSHSGRSRSSESYRRGSSNVRGRSSKPGSVRDTGYDLNDFMESFRRTMDADLSEVSFRSGEEALRQLEKDEMSWKQKQDIPAELEDFSVVDPSYDRKLSSMGSFFKQRSDNLSTLLAKSPEKVPPPVPLIETSVADITTRELNDDSLSVSAIARVLSDTTLTPNKAINYLLNAKKKQRGDQNKEKSSSPTLSESPTLELFEERRNENFKENVSPNSSVPSRSSSPLSNLPNGKLPIATTKTEIVWGCIKPGKNVSQDFFIKNKSSRRIGIVCTVSNPSFRLIEEDSKINFSSTVKLNLQPYETRNLTVTFAPTTAGAAFDCLQFSPVDSRHQQLVKQHVNLFGYGGYGNVVLKNIIKDTSGEFLLSLGSIDNLEAISRKFVVRNIGTLPSFARIVFVSSVLYLFSSVKVTPQVLVLLPEEEREVVVTYEPKKDDINFIQAKNNCVIDIGKLAVTSGTEADRGRLRRLHKERLETGLQSGASVEQLVEKFPGEVIPNDVKQLKESIQSTDQILRLMNTTEVVITLEQDLDSSVMGFQDETAIFYSLCE